jgi:hypothetical protein
MSTYKIYDPLRSTEAFARRKFSFNTPQRSDIPVHPEGASTLTEKILRHQARTDELSAAAPEAEDSATNETAESRSINFLQEPTYATVSATSGRDVLAFMKGTSDSLDNTKLNGVYHVCAATALRDTDRAIWLYLKQQVNTPESLFALWLKEAEFRQRDDQFRRDFDAGSDRDLRKCMESMFEYVIENKETSAELATKFIMWSATRSIRIASDQSKAVIEFSNASRLMLLCDAYLDAEHITYEGVFRGQCQSRTLDLTLTIKNKATVRPIEERPGWDRLTHSDPEIRVTSWAWMLVDAISFMAGAREKNQVDMEPLRSAFFCPKDPNRGHGLRFGVNAEGDFTDIYTWFPNEELAVMQLADGARKTGRNKLAADEYDRVCNALRCMTAKVSMDFREEWTVQFGKHEQVPDDVVVPKDTNVPVISFALCKDIMKRTQVAVRKDLDKHLIRRKAMANAAKGVSEAQQKGPVQGNSNQGGGSNSALPAGTSDGHSKLCRVCQSKDHLTEVCPKRTGKPCGFWVKFGRCNFGDRCKLEHTAANEGQKGAASLSTGLNETDTALPVGQSDVKKMQMVSCKDKHSGGCEPNFMIDLDFYQKKCAEDGWSMPKSCKACRDKSRIDRSAAERPTGNSLFVSHSEHDAEYEEADDEYLCQDMQMSGLMTTSAMDDGEMGFQRTVDTRFEYGAVEVSTLDSEIEQMLLEGACFETSGVEGEQMCIGNIDQMIEDMDELLTCDENPFFASLMTSDIEGFAQCGEEVCCSQAIEQSEPEFSACSSARDLLTTAGGTKEFDIGEDFIQAQKCAN